MIDNKKTLQTGYYSADCTKNHCIEKASNAFYRAYEDALDGGPYKCDICGGESPGVMRFKFDPVGIAAAYKRSIDIIDAQRDMYVRRHNGVASYMSMIGSPAAGHHIPPCDLCEKEAVTINWKRSPSPRCEEHREDPAFHLMEFKPDDIESLRTYAATQGISAEQLDSLMEKAGKQLADEFSMPSYPITEREMKEFIEYELSVKDGT